MDLGNMDSGVRQDLVAAGWDPDRVVDTIAVEKGIEEYGYHVNAHAKEFLRVFHGLTLMTVNGPWTFDACEALACLERSDAPYIDRIIEESLCPVGYGGRMLLFASGNGRALLLHDEWVGFVLLPRIDIALNAVVRFDSHGDTCSANWHYFTDDQVPPAYR